MYNKKRPRVLVINSTFPEIDYLAAELSIRNSLYKYIRPYANKNRVWEKGIAKAPYFGRLYLETFERRRLPSGLQPRSVCEAALVHDFLYAIFTRLRFIRNGWKNRYLNKLLLKRTWNLGENGASLAKKADVVIAGWGVAEPAFRIIKKKGGKAILNYSIAHHRFSGRFLCEEAQKEPLFSSTLSFHNYPKKLIRRLDYECDNADYILVGSSFVKESFVSEGINSKKILVIPYGADLKIFRPDNSHNRNLNGMHILFVGQIGQRKGISYLIRAYKKFQKFDTRLTLVGNFIGDTQVFSKYIHLFHHIPNVPRKCLPRIFQKADVFLFPSLIEGMPLVVLEAMACGLPVIVTANGPGDIVRDGTDGFVVPIRNVNAIVDRLKFLYNNPEARRQMGFNARQRALQYGWQIYAKKAADAVNKIYRMSDIE